MMSQLSRAVMSWLRTTSHRLKHGLYRNFWLWSPILIALVLIWLVAPSDLALGLEWRQRLAITGGILTGLYLLQKQKLEETQLFVDLFESFNHRYDALNDDLNDLKGTKQVCGELCPEERKLLDSYFNLCAEEYLFYKQGYIPAEVWRSWRDGMAYYMEDPAIRDAWKRDKRKQGASFYGLDMPGEDR